MRKHLLDLSAIQRIDLEIRDVKKRLESLPSVLKQLEEAARVLKADLARSSTERDQYLREAKTMETTVQAEEQKIRKWDKRLQDIRNQREFLALSREIEGGRRANREMEDRELELMTKCEGLDKEIAAMNARLAQGETEIQAERGRVGSESETSSLHMRGLEQERAGLSPEIPKTLWRKYEFVRDRRLGVGMARAIDGNCQACNIRLPPQLYNTLIRGDSVEQCPSCQRILLWEDPAAGAVASSEVVASPG